MFSIGERICWQGVRRTETGIIREETSHGYIVSVANWKCVIVSESSARREESEQPV